MEKLGDIEFRVGLEKLGESEITPINSKGDSVTFFLGGGLWGAMNDGHFAQRATGWPVVTLLPRFCLTVLDSLGILFPSHFIFHPNLCSVTIFTDLTLREDRTLFPASHIH